MKDVKGYEDTYAIDEAGRVWSKKRQIYVKHYIDHKGYPRAGLWAKVDGKWTQKNKQVHRLVAETFIPNPDGKPVTNHIDGDPMNCHVTNLEWVTHSENVKDGFNRGRVAWNKNLKSTKNMNLEDLARELPRLQVIAKSLFGEKRNITKYRHILEGEWFDDVTLEAYQDIVDAGEANNHWEQYVPLYEEKGWQYHLQQMVISPDPIDYLRKWLEGVE
jgi:hypothetical protein